MMRIITVNLNGIRSAEKKGFFKWLSQQEADILCAQEIRCPKKSMKQEFLNPCNLTGYFQYALKNGYSGSGLYTKYKPSDIIIGFRSNEFDKEGRYVEIRFNNLSIISVYFPSGSISYNRQQAKYRFMSEFMKHITNLKKTQEIILCGDLNIVHKRIDIKNWEENQNNSGCLPDEREWIDNLFKIGYVDIFRKLNPESREYTWWSNRGKSYENNIGWRIDYQITTQSIACTAKNASIFKDTRFSDHSPLIVDYDYILNK